MRLPAVPPGGPSAPLRGASPRRSSRKSTLAPPLPPLPPPRAAQPPTSNGSAHPALAEAAIARGDPPILRSVTAKASTLVDAVCAAAPQLDETAALALLSLGGVYLGERPSGPKGPLKWRRCRQRATAAAVLARGGGGGGGEEKQPAARTAAAAATTAAERGDWRRQPVAAGVPIRVHASPKRFSAACARVRVIAADLTSGYVAISKPAGLPSMAHESNDAEHAGPCAEAALRRERGPLENDDGGNAVRLQLCHRLDTWTSGVLVLATNPAAAARFGEALKAPPLPPSGEGEAGGGGGGGNGGGGDDEEATPFSDKTYLAIARGAPNPEKPYPQTLVAWMYDGPFGDRVPAAGGLPLGARGPRLLAREEPSSSPLPSSSSSSSSSSSRSWKKCELVIERAEPASPDTAAWAEALDRRARGEMAAAAAQAAAAAAGGEAEDEGDAENENNPQQQHQPYHLLTIRLLTGRTHQIRAQLAAAGCPLAGDSMYAPLAGRRAPVLADPRTGAVAATGGGLAAVRRASQAQVSGPIGLHAWRLRWRERGGGKVREYVAPAPWEEEE